MHLIERYHSYNCVVCKTVRTADVSEVRSSHSNYTTDFLSEFLFERQFVQETQADVLLLIVILATRRLVCPKTPCLLNAFHYFSRQLQSCLSHFRLTNTRNKRSLEKVFWCFRIFVC